MFFLATCKILKGVRTDKMHYGKNKNHSVFLKKCNFSTPEALDQFAFLGFLSPSSCASYTVSYRCDIAALFFPDALFPVPQDDISAASSFMTHTTTYMTIAFTQGLLHPVHIDRYPKELCIWACMSVRGRQTEGDASYLKVSSWRHSSFPSSHRWRPKCRLQVCWLPHEQNNNVWIASEGSGYSFKIVQLRSRSPLLRGISILRDSAR